MKLAIDRQFGKSAELTTRSEIEQYLNQKIIPLSTFDNFDFVTKNDIYIELKTRRTNLNTYPDTMICLYKIKKARQLLKEKYKVYFFFKFNDHLTVYEFTEYKKEFVRLGGRQDRNKDERCNYYFIPTSFLTIV